MGWWAQGRGPPPCHTIAESPWAGHPGPGLPRLPSSTGHVGQLSTWAAEGSRSAQPGPRTFSFPCGKADADSPESMAVERDHSEKPWEMRRAGRVVLEGRHRGSREAGAEGI